jgi:hypothetical protein
MENCFWAVRRLSGFSFPGDSPENEKSVIRPCYFHGCNSLYVCHTLADMSRYTNDSLLDIYDLIVLREQTGPSNMKTICT